ncbi:MAG: hypothetical protein AAF633_11620, partial [Chloroflexota bacterium]
EQHKNGRVRFLDLSSAQDFECHSAVSGKRIPWPDGKMQNDEGKVRFSYPTHMHTAEFARGPDEFLYAVEPLMRVCQASIETGNPICWC